MHRDLLGVNLQSPLLSYCIRESNPKVSVAQPSSDLGFDILALVDFSDQVDMGFSLLLYRSVDQIC